MIDSVQHKRLYEQVTFAGYPNPASWIFTDSIKQCIAAFLMIVVSGGVAGRGLAQSSTEFTVPPPERTPVRVDAAHAIEPVNREVMGVCLPYLPDVDKLVELFDGCLDGTSGHLWGRWRTEPEKATEMMGEDMPFVARSGMVSRYLYVCDPKIRRPAEYESPDDNNLDPWHQPSARAELFRRLNKEPHPGFPHGFGVDRFRVWCEPQFAIKGGWDPEAYARYSIDVAHAIHEVDPSVQIGVNDHTGSVEWTERMLRAVAAEDREAIRFLAIHLFSMGWHKTKGTLGEYYARIAMSEAERKQVLERVELAWRLGHGNWHVDASAWNIHPMGFGPPFDVSTDMAVALHVASMFGVFWETGIQAAHIFQLASGGTEDTHFVLAQKKEDGFTLRPAGEVFRLYGTYFRGSRMTVNLDSPSFHEPVEDLDVPLVIAHAAHDPKKQRLVTILSNKHKTEPVEIDLTLSNWQPSLREAQWISLTSDSPTAREAVREQRELALPYGPSPSVKLTLPPHSIHAIVSPGVVLKAPADGGPRLIRTVTVVGVADPAAVSHEEFLSGAALLPEDAEYAGLQLKADPQGIVNVASTLELSGRAADIPKGFPGEARGWIFAPTKADYTITAAIQGRGTILVNGEVVAVGLGGDSVALTSNDIVCGLRQGWNKLTVRLVSNRRGMAFRIGLVNRTELQAGTGMEPPPWPSEWTQRVTTAIGIDLHKDSLTICVMSPDGSRWFDTLPTKCRGRIEYFFLKLSETHRVAATVESVGFYHWFWDLVQPLVDRLFLADASRVRAAAGRRAKTDRNDAETLARLLRQDSLPCAYVPDPDLRAFRQLVRHRDRIRRRISSCKSSLRMEMNKLNLPGPKVLSTASLHKWFTAMFERLPGNARFAISQLADQLALFERQMLALTDEVCRTIDGNPRFADPVRRLETIPGIATTTAAVIFAETGGLARFDLESEVICYAGLAPRTFQSADSCRHGHIGKDGPPIMRKCLINAAWCAVRTNPAVKRRFEDYRRTRGKKKAIVKLAAKMLGWAWAMQRRQENFDVTHLQPAAV